MAFSWSKFSLRRFYGLDKKSNIMDVKDGFSLDCMNVFQDGRGRVTKRRGTYAIFDKDSSSPVDGIGACTLNGQKFYFKFSGGSFFYATSLLSALTEIAPSPSVGDKIWWAVADNKLFFVDGQNKLRFFDGTDIKVSEIKERPQNAPTTSAGSGTLDYAYTLDNGMGESPVSPILGSRASLAPITIPSSEINTGDKIRIYSKPETIAAASFNVTASTGGSNVTYGSDETGNYAEVVDGSVNVVVATVVLDTNTQMQLYTERGIFPNRSAPVGLDGIINHYGRLVGWMGDWVYSSKRSNPNSFPDSGRDIDAEPFLAIVTQGNGFKITACVSFLENLYVFKENECWVLGGVGPTDSGKDYYSYRRLEVNGNGCIAGKSAVVIDTYLVYLSRNGFYATNGSDPIRVGEKIEPEIQDQTFGNLETCVAFYNKREGIYVANLGASGARKTFALDVRMDNEEMVGWFEWNSLNFKSVFYDENFYIAGRFDGLCVAEQAGFSSFTFSDPSIEIASGVDVGERAILVSGEYYQGQPVIIRGDNVPYPLSSGDTYYAVPVEGLGIGVASSLGDAMAGSKLVLGAASGFSVVSHNPFDAYYTTNWLNFKYPSWVKKLGKLSVLVDVGASNIEISIFAAYNWENVFNYEDDIIFSSIHTWGADVWGIFPWAVGDYGQPRNIALARRKCRSVRYRFFNNSINSDFHLLGVEQNFDVMRNRGNFA